MKECHHSHRFRYGELLARISYLQEQLSRLGFSSPPDDSFETRWRKEAQAYLKQEREAAASAAFSQGFQAGLTVKRRSVSPFTVYYCKHCKTALDLFTDLESKIVVPGVSSGQPLSAASREALEP